jgi:excisionase family DNA binding protein
MTATRDKRSSATNREVTRSGGAIAGQADVQFPPGDYELDTPLTIDRQTFMVEEVATLLGIGRNSAYQAIARGELPALRLGRRLLVPRAALERHLAESGAVERDAPGRRRA